MLISNSLFRLLPKLKMFLKAYSKCPFHSDFKNGMEKIESVEICKNCDKEEEAGGQARILIKMSILLIYHKSQTFPV